LHYYIKACLKNITKILFSTGSPTSLTKIAWAVPGARLPKKKQQQPQQQKQQQQQQPKKKQTNKQTDKQTKTLVKYIQIKI